MDKGEPANSWEISFIIALKQRNNEFLSYLANKISFHRRREIIDWSYENYDNHWFRNHI